MRPFVLRATAIAVLAGSTVVCSLPAQHANRGSQSERKDSGSVRGTVFDAETGRPLRFAFVMMTAKPDSVHVAQEDPINVTGRADATGHFAIEDVPAGDYFAFAVAQGYLTEKDRLLAEVRRGSDPVGLLDSFPTVHVTQDTVGQVSLTLQHGASLSGTAVWEDGSPAANVAVEAILSTDTAASKLPPPLDQISFPLATVGQPISDDRGFFRIPGLAPGEYVVRGVVRARFDSNRSKNATGSFFLQSYAPGELKKGAAKKYSVSGGESRSDVTLKLSLDETHTVSGRALFGGSEGVVAGSGRVLLVSTVDPDFQYRAALSHSGTFSLANVPTGSYKLTVEDAHSADGRTAAEYEQSLVVLNSDISSLELILASPEKAGSGH